MLKLLIIDDEVDIFKYLKNYFERRGITVFTADNGEKGLELVKKHNPSLVLLDINMPEMSGIEVLAKIKKDSPERKVIMLTAYGDKENREKAKKADDFLTKPFQLSNLEGVVSLNI